MERLLRCLRLDTISFASAEAFLARDSEPEARCLVLDLRLPGIDGLALQQELTRRARKIPIVFIAGCAESREREQAFAGGAIGFLTKPFQDVELLSAVQQALGDPAGTLEEGPMHARG